MSQAVADLKREFRGQVFGRLPDVCSVKARKYNNAIAVLSGRHMDSVVVTTLDAAKDCMHYLKEKHLDPMEFIPLDNITVRTLTISISLLLQWAPPRVLSQHFVLCAMQVEYASVVQALHVWYEAACAVLTSWTTNADASDQ